MIDWDAVPRGTIRHRLQCPHLRVEREAAGSTALVQRMLADLAGPPSPHHVKWTRALVAVPPYGITPPQEESFDWVTPLVATEGPKVFYVDASGVDPTDPRIRRIGWSFVVVEASCSTIIGSASGRPPRGWIVWGRGKHGHFTRRLSTRSQVIPMSRTAWAP